MILRLCSKNEQFTKKCIRNDICKSITYVGQLEWSNLSDDGNEFDW